MVLLTAASAAQGFVYFNSVTDDPGRTIGRANLDGTGANLTFIADAGLPCGIEVDGAHVYWANQHDGRGSNTIGRSALDGEVVDQTFIEGARMPCGVAVDGAHIYWANTAGPVDTAVAQRRARRPLELRRGVWMTSSSSRRTQPPSAPSGTASLVHAPTGRSDECRNGTQWPARLG